MRRQKVYKVWGNTIIIMYHHHNHHHLDIRPAMKSPCCKSNLRFDGSAKTDAGASPVERTIVYSKPDFLNESSALYFQLRIP